MERKRVMSRKSLVVGLALCFAIILGSSTAVLAKMPTDEPSPELLVTGLETATGAGSAIGPGGALYVTEGVAGRISRVDPKTGEVTTFASGLPQAILPVGGVMDVAFIGDTAYALVTMVSGDPLFGGSDIVGIYRVDGPNSFTVVADLGEFALNNPSNSSVFIKTGVHYALETYRGGFLVTDGHHNRVLWVTLDGEITEMIAFGNIVPTGLDVHGDTVYAAFAGPVPHLAEDGKIMAFGPKSSTATEVASGARLAVDVEFGRGRKLYALSQGEWDGAGEGSPAFPGTGALMEVNEDGTFSVVVDGLDRPTSFEFIGNTAYYVTLGGEIWTVHGVSGPPFGVSR
jgi:hypothetical protein